VSAGRVGLAAALTTVAVGGALARASEQGPQVRVATTGNDSELVKTLPITRRLGAEKRVVMSLKPAALPSLVAGDRLRVTAEVQVTGNCRAPGPRCVGSIYRYDPRVRASLILAQDARTTGGDGAVPIAALKRETCTQHRPDYEHHCVLVFSKAGIAIGDPARLPCPLDSCYVNLVADAHHRRASRGDRIMVGGLRPDGAIPQDRGRINVIRYRDASAADAQASSTEQRLKRRLPPDFKRRVVFSERLSGLDDGEQLAVSATMRTDISQLRYAVRTSARLILADSPQATRQSAFVKARAFGRGEISENNGSNCTQAEGSCITRKVGVLEMRRDAVDGQGRAVPLYVNLVTVLGPKVRRAQSGDRVILRRGGISVLRFPPALNG
jgi:hypothetical protein